MGEGGEESGVACTQPGDWGTRFILFPYTRKSRHVFSPTPKHTHTHPTPPAACARVCLHALRGLYCLKNLNKRPTKNRRGTSTTTSLVIIFYLYADYQMISPLPPSKGKNLGEERGEKVPLRLG